LQNKKEEIKEIDKIITNGFNEGLNKGLEKSNNLAIRISNILDKVRFKKTDLEIYLEKKVTKLENRVSNLIKRKNMYKKKSLDFENDYKRIRSKYQKTEEFQRELKQLQMMNEYNALSVDEKPKPKTPNPTAMEENQVLSSTMKNKMKR